jgi:hypothetical protein
MTMSWPRDDKTEAKAALEALRKTWAIHGLEVVHARTLVMGAINCNLSELCSKEILDQLLRTLSASDRAKAHSEYWKQFVTNAAKHGHRLWPPGSSLEYVPEAGKLRIANWPRNLACIRETLPVLTTVTLQASGGTGLNAAN